MGIKTALSDGYQKNKIKKYIYQASHNERQFKMHSSGKGLQDWLNDGFRNFESEKINI